MATETTNVAIWRSLAETDPEIAAVLQRRAAPSERRSRADRVGKLRQPRRARGRRVRARPTSTPKAIPAGATTAAASSSTSPSARRSHAPRRCSAPTTSTSSRIPGAQANMSVYVTAAQAGRHGPRHEPRARRPPHPRPPAQFLGPALHDRALRRPPGRRTDRLRRARCASPIEHKPKMIIVGASAYPRVIDFARIRADGDARRRGDVHRHGAHRRPRRRRRASQPGPAFRFRVDDDAQDAARTARRHGDVPRTVRQGSRPQRCSPACRAAR